MIRPASALTLSTLLLAACGTTDTSRPAATTAPAAMPAAPSVFTPTGGVTTASESPGADGRTTGTLLAAPASDLVAGDFLDNQKFIASTRVANGGRGAPNPAREQMVEALLKRMTTEEKVGQMTQVTIDVVVTGKAATTAIDTAKLAIALRDHHVGSLLNVVDGALQPEHWHRLIGQIQSAAAKTRLKIPILYGIDGIHGHNYSFGTTLFPQEQAMAATFNPMLAERAAAITAYEIRATGIPWNFSPVLDLGRQPLWSRFWETYGEDVTVARTMGAAVIRGYQGDDVSRPDKVAACLKHYVGYSLPTSGRDRTPALIPENTLRELFLPSFEAAIEAGARSVMINSAEVNGVPAHASHFLLTEVLRDELHFDGVAVSDWEDIKKLVTVHRVAATEKEATRMAVMAGVDMSMVPLDYLFYDHLLALVKEGQVPMSRIDEATRRILRLKADLGLFDKPGPDFVDMAQMGSVASRQVSLQAAREAITLLKNDNVLPLAAGKKVFVTGPTANVQTSLNNGWSYTWQGNREELYPTNRLTILGAIRAVAGEANVTFAPGVALEKEIDIAAAVRGAQAADVVVLALGEGAYCETPGSIEDLTLPEPQLRLAEAMAATGKPVVLVLAEGRPRIISRIADRMNAIVLAYNPGLEGGQAIAEVLTGAVNPSGKLPYSYPRHPNHLLTYDYKFSETADATFGTTGYNPQFPFGAGLSYTTFAYSGLTVAKPTINSGEGETVSVTVTNTGSRAGKETVIVYLRDMFATITPPVHRVKRFAKVTLQPGEKRTLTFTLERDDLAFIGQNNKPTVEPGAFQVEVGGLNAMFTLQSSAK